MLSSVSKQEVIFYLVLRSKKHRQIESARPLVQELIAAGMFWTVSSVDGVLANIGE